MLDAWLLPAILMMNLLQRVNFSYILFKVKFVLVKKFDIPVKCNVIWDELAVAYRCYTCGLNACMSLCSTCFEAGKFEDLKIILIYYEFRESQRT